MKRLKNMNNFEAPKVAAHLRDMAEKLGGVEYTDKSISQVEKKILEERGLLKYVEWIREDYIKMEKLMKIILLIVLLNTLGVSFFLIYGDKSKKKYNYTPNRMILRETSYLMKITNQKILDELKSHPSVYRKERLALGTYLEHTSSGILIANTKESLNYKFKKLEDYEGTNEVILGFSFKADKISISKPLLCELIENENELKGANESSSIPDKEKKNLNIGSCIVKIPNDPMYSVYPKKRFKIKDS